jgi:hypothetical protein
MSPSDRGRKAGLAFWNGLTPKQQKKHAKKADKVLNKSLTPEQLSERNRANVLSRWAKKRLAEIQGQR